MQPILGCVLVKVCCVVRLRVISIPAELPLSLLSALYSSIGSVNILLNLASGQDIAA
jgi:ABC-type enterochelin transport system permease subunit